MPRMADTGDNNFCFITIIFEDSNNLIHKLHTVTRDIIQTANERAHITGAGFCRHQRLQGRNGRDKPLPHSRPGQCLLSTVEGAAASGGTTYEGRYGHVQQPGSGSLSPIMSNKWFEYGQNYWSFVNSPGTATVNDAGSFGSPPDPFGVGVVGLDQGGWPSMRA